MPQISCDELADVLTWIDTFELSKPRKSINRDFSDCLLLAEILKQLYPKLVELHNYPARNSFTLKMDNWKTLNRKVLRRIGSPQTDGQLDHLSKATTGAIETLLFDIMTKYNENKNRSKLSGDFGEEIAENCEIIMVNVERKFEDHVEIIEQKMIIYSLYEKLEETVEEQRKTITILMQKVEHLDNMLKLKSKRIEDLSSRLARKSNSIMPQIIGDDKIQVILAPNPTQYKDANQTENFPKI